jgi:hypothetical protein
MMPAGEPQDGGMQFKIYYATINLFAVFIDISEYTKIKNRIVLRKTSNW